MQRAALSGHSNLVLEDEPLIALDIAESFAQAGAVVLPVRTFGDAHQVVEHNSLSAAVLNFRNGDADAGGLRTKLIARDIPFVIHSGYSHMPQQRAVVIPKLATPRELIDAIGGLLSRREIPNA